MIIILLSMSVMLMACDPKIEVRGNLPSPSRMAQLEVGVQNAQDVADLLGSPSAIATFDSYTWFYISTRREGYAFFEKDITQHMVLELTFDKDTLLISDIQRYDQSDLKEIAFLDRETPTSGREFTLIEQLFGNLGARPMN